MAFWENATKTTAGLALEQKLMSGNLTLKLTKAKAGTGYVNPVQLMLQTDVSGAVQDLQLGDIMRSDSGNTVTLPVTLSNESLASGYSLYQVGVYAEDPDSGEILYFIAQTSAEGGESIPSKTESPGFTIDWNFAFNNSNTNNVEVVLNEAGRLNVDQADARYAKKEDLTEVANLVKASAPTYTAVTMSADGWNAETKKYNFESSYPFAQYDIEIQPSDTCTTEQLDAWSGAQLVGSATENAVKAYGDVPTVDIPIIIKAVMKNA